MYDHDPAEEMSRCDNCGHEWHIVQGSRCPKCGDDELMPDGAFTTPIKDRTVPERVALHHALLDDAASAPSSCLGCGHEWRRSEPDELCPICGATNERLERARAFLNSIEERTDDEHLYRTITEDGADA